MATFDALCIEPGHGSVWLSDVRFEKGNVVGQAWDRFMVGSAYMPDDYRGEWVTLRFPARFILKLRRRNYD